MGKNLKNGKVWYLLEVIKDNGDIVYIGYIYRHWIINENGLEKSYIGKTTREPMKRWSNGKAYKRSKKFYNAINCYGWDNFHHDIILIIECCDSFDLDFWLASWEEYYIEKYDSVNSGYNYFKKSVIQSEDIRYEMGKGCRGVSKSEEHRRKISESNKGKKHSKESREKLSKTRKEKGLAKGEKNNFYGKHFNGAENGNAKQVICLNTRQVFNTMNEAAEWCNAKDTTGISKCCHGIYPYSRKHPETGEKLKWMFYIDYLKEKDDNNYENK